MILLNNVPYSTTENLVNIQSRFTRSLGSRANNVPIVRKKPRNNAIKTVLMGHTYQILPTKKLSIKATEREIVGTVQRLGIQTMF